MRSASLLLALFAAANVSLQAPALAFAGDVQSVPYNPSQPVPVQGQPPTAPMPPPPPPPGGASGTDVIVLKGGGMLRGRLIEVIPNDHATIALATGQNAIVQWNRIDRIEQQPAGPPPPPPPGAGVYGAPPPPPPLPPAGHRGRAWVHIEGPPGLTLAGRGPSGAYEPMCATPCDQELPLDYGYRIQGPNIRNSREFALEARPGQRIIMTVKAASKTSFTAGIVLVSVGPAVILTGLVVVLVGAAQSAANFCATAGTDGTIGSCSSDPGAGTRTTGWVLTLIGVGGTIAGGVLLGTNARTSVTEELVQPGMTPVGEAARTREDAWLRGPTWHDAPTFERAIPTPQTVPIFSHTF